MIRCPRCHRRLDGAACDEHGPPTRSQVPVLPAAPPVRLSAWSQGDCIAVGGSAQLFTAVASGGGSVVVKWARWCDAAARKRSAREASLLRRVGPPSVPALVDAGVAEGWPYLVLEHLRGQTVAQHIATHGRTRIAAEASRLMAAITARVQALHRRGVIHGDLKPENVFLHVTELGFEARLIDLGLAVAIDDPDSPAADGAGTPHYAAPEQLHGLPLTTATDVYALGIMAFELLTGRPPFVGDRPAIEYGHTLCRPPRLSELAMVPAELETIVLATLAKRPHDRPALADLHAAFEQAGTTARADSVAATQRRHERGPAALMWIWGGDRARIAATVTEAAGRIVRERGDGTLAAFLWHDHDLPVHAARAVATQLGGGVTVIVHSGEVLVRRAGSRVAVHGELVDHPERWCPRTPCTGVLFTAAAADHVGGEIVHAETVPGFHRLLERDRPARSEVATVPELVARNGLVDDLVRAIEAAAGGDGPRLLTIVGATGAGKSRTLAELRRRLGGCAMRLIELAGQTGVAGRPTVGPALAAALAGVPGLSLLDRLRAAAAEHGVVLLVDDAHRVEDEVLDLLDTAAAWLRARIAIVATTDPAMLEARPRWGAMATHHDRYHLRPLDDDSAHALLRRQLAPARRIPDALIARLAARAGGNPGTLAGLAHEIHRRGLVRRFPGSEEFYVAADELDAIALQPDRRWHAARELAGLPAGMAGFVGVCAVLGAGFDLPELEAVQRVLPEGEPTIDPAAGTAWLERNRILRRVGDGWTFTAEPVRESAYEQCAGELRVAIHTAALVHVERAPRGTPADRLGRIAHHARGAGRREAAVAAFTELARLARLRHSHVEAERMATHAVDVAGDEDASQLAAALTERARARRPMTYFEGARADLERARALAIAAGARDQEIETLVEDGAICDFTDRLVESAAAIEHAAALLAETTPPWLRARVDNWLGVVRARQGRLDEAAVLLGRAIAVADEIDDHETAVGAMLMLGGVQRRALALEDARATLDAAIARSEARGDVFHITVGLFNRINLWRMLGQSANAEADCARAIEIAERHGYGQMEIAGWLNLSEVCLAGARDRDALDAARRGFAVARRRFGERPPVVATSWLALLEAGHGHTAEAQALLAYIDPAEAGRSPLLSLRRDAVVAVTAPRHALDAVIDGTRRLELDDRMAFVWFLRRQGVAELAA